jgi:hypothetical protein
VPPLHDPTSGETILGSTVTAEWQDLLLEKIAAAVPEQTDDHTRGRVLDSIVVYLV